MIVSLYAFPQSLLVLCRHGTTHHHMDTYSARRFSNILKILSTPAYEWQEKRVGKQNLKPFASFTFSGNYIALQKDCKQKSVDTMNAHMLFARLLRLLERTWP